MDILFNYYAFLTIEGLFKNVAIIVKLGVLEEQ